MARGRATHCGAGANRVLLPQARVLGVQPERSDGGPRSTRAAHRLPDERDQRPEHPKLRFQRHQSPHHETGL